MSSNKYCIIMAGGVGSRLWPLSRNTRPKQFIDFLSTGRSLMQMTIDRAAHIVPKERILIVTNEKYRDLVESQAEGIPAENLLYEPYRRNTAPCIAYAVYKLFSKDPDATVMITPSDHAITDECNFVDTMSAVMDYAATHDQLFTIGIKPTFPNTNFGYIQFNKDVNTGDTPKRGYQVKTFTEKPDLDLATVFFESGEFLWNSGIFIFNLKTIKAEMERYLPEMTDLFNPKGKKVYNTAGEKDFIEHSYNNSPSISIDYGVMEKTRKAWVFPADFGWSDLGTWESVFEYAAGKDAEGNIIHGNTIISGTNGSVVISKNPKKLIVVKGLDNYLVVDSDNALMVCPRRDEQVKEILVDLTAQDKGEYL
ncbi:MAG: mannose-1-phosphate guanylyltransferase [Bacteroidales bacterium]|nr:mannose-1-phosphate guanylyltransferase [Bacteroidales bacterium]MBQ9583215.1 mannose-1-phosphate guanylyltransferase [Bacteroidales bacterium]